MLGEDHPDTLAAINNLGLLLQAQGKLAEADALFTEAIRSCRRAFPRPHPTTALLLHHHADVLRVTGRLDEAEKPAREAVAMYREHPDWSANEARHAEKVLADTLSAAAAD